jgi:hypothetical protein
MRQLPFFQAHGVFFVLVSYPTDKAASVWHSVFMANNKNTFRTFTDGDRCDGCGLGGFGGRTGYIINGAHLCALCHFKADKAARHARYAAQRR